VGARPAYADIDPESLNVDANDLESKITGETKAIILQHTFGRPGPIEALVGISKKHNILLIEDCAHSLGATFNGKKLGTFGDVAILSFGREKVVSSLAGGAILIRNRKLEPAIKKVVDSLTYPSFTSFLKELNNFFTWRILIRKIFFSKSGSNLLSFLNKHDFFNVVTSSKELVGERPSWYPKLFPGTLAKIASQELERVDEVNRKRREIAIFYEKKIKNRAFKLLPYHDGVYLRYVVLHQNTEKVYEQAKKRKFWFGNWYNTPVYPKRVNLSKMGYVLGTCPVAEKVSAQTANLPNFQGMTRLQAQEAVDFINSFKA
jgi:dTDP-4-amino-4,6-dideoxygalactose transaminase